jgi:hypothetical protein
MKNKKKYFTIGTIIILLVVVGNLFNSDYEKKKKIETLSKTITEQKTKLDKKDETISNLKTALALSVQNGSISINNADGSSITANGSSIGINSNTSSNTQNSSSVSSSSQTSSQNTQQSKEEESIKKGSKRFHIAFGKNFIGNDAYYMNLGVKLFQIPLVGWDIGPNLNMESNFRTGFILGAGIQGSF